jgi:hypothetical protein
MADHGVRKVSSSPLLIAAIAAALVAGAIWFSMRGPGGDTGADAGAPVISPVDDYLTFVDRLAATDSGTDALALEGMRKLAAALGTLEVGGADLPVDLRIVAEHIAISPESVETTGAVQPRLLAAAVALDGQVSAASELQLAAHAIDSQMPLTQQRQALVTFFTRAGESIRRAGLRAQ